MTEIMTLGEIQVIPIDRIKPYWRNPRRVPEEAVNALVTSIQEFGYQQPLVVDSDLMIIVGHTRYAAMRRLDVTEVPIVIADGLSAAQVRQYRLVDNRVGEFASWDYEKLMEELGSFERDLLTNFFPEFSGIEAKEDSLIQETLLLDQQWGDVDTSVEFVCPHCYHEFEMNVTHEAVVSGRLEAPK